MTAESLEGRGRVGAVRDENSGQTGGEEVEPTLPRAAKESVSEFLLAAG